MNTFFDRDRIRWIRFLIVFEILYILSEFALNAAILNAGGGLVITEEGINNLEKYGRLLSGVGLALLVFGFLGSRYSFKRRLLNFILTLIVCIPLMFKAQSILIDDLIIGNASAEARSRAALLATYKEGLITGNFNFGKGIPLDRDNPTNAEELTIFSMYSLIMLDSDEVERIMRKDLNALATSVVKIRMSLQASNLYEEYLKASKILDSEWKKFKSKRDGIDPNTHWQDIYRQSEKQFANYKHLRDVEFPKHIEKLIIQNNIHQLLYNQYEKAFSKGCGTNCRRRELGKVEAIMKQATGYKTNWQKWCDGNKCPGDEKFLAKQAAPLMSNLFSQLARMEIDMNLKTTSEFMNQRPILETIRSEYKSKGIELPFGMVMNKANFIKELGKETGFAIKTKEQFIAWHKTQQKISEMTSFSFDTPMILGLSKSQFENKYLAPKIPGLVKLELQHIGGDKQHFENGGRNAEVGNYYLKMIIVPPIALFFSLFFSLFALARLPLRLLEISQIRSPANWKVKFKRYMTMLDLIVIISLPIMRSSSKFTSASVISNFERIRGEKFEAHQVLGYKWVLGVEPTIYPIGMSILNAFGLNNIDHPKYK